MRIQLLNLVLCGKNRASTDDKKDQPTPIKPKEEKPTPAKPTPTKPKEENPTPTPMRPTEEKPAPTQEPSLPPGEKLDNNDLFGDENSAPEMSDTGAENVNQAFQVMMQPITKLMKCTNHEDVCNAVEQFPIPPEIKHIFLEHADLLLSLRNFLLQTQGADSQSKGEEMWKDFVFTHNEEIKILIIKIAVKIKGSLNTVQKAGIMKQLKEGLSGLFTPEDIQDIENALK